jgi:hypothetical protein
MSRVPVIAIGLMVACVGVIGLAFLKSRTATTDDSGLLPPPPAPARPVARVEAPALSRPSAPTKATAILPGNPIEHAVDKTLAAGSFTYSFTTALGAGDAFFTTVGTAAVDVEHRLTAIDEELHDLSRGAAGKPSHSNMVIDQRQGLVEYVTSPQLYRRLPGRKSWVRFDYGTTDQTDLDQVLTVLRHASRPTIVERGAVGPITATHYRARVDLRRLAAGTTGPAREVVRHALAAGVKRYTVDVWIDDQGYLRKYGMSILRHKPDLTHTKFAREQTTGVLSDFGAKLRVRVPPAAATVRSSALPQ